MEIPSFDIIYANIPQKLVSLRVSINIPYLQKFTEKEIEDMFMRIPQFNTIISCKDENNSQDSDELTNDKTLSPKRKDLSKNQWEISVYIKGLSHMKHWYFVMKNLLKLHIVRINMDSHLGTAEELNSWFMILFCEKDSIKEITLRFGNPANGSQRKMVRISKDFNFSIDLPVTYRTEEKICLIELNLNYSLLVPWKENCELSIALIWSMTYLTCIPSVSSLLR